MRGARNAFIVARKRLMAAHHGADAVEQHGAAHDARDRCGRCAEEGTAAARTAHHATAHHATAHRGALLVAALRVTAGWIARYRSGRLTGVRPRTPDAARTLAAGPHRGHRSARLVTAATRDHVAHAVEESAALLGGLGAADGVLEFFDARGGALEGFI